MVVNTLLATNESFIYFSTHTLTSCIDIYVRIVSILTRIEIIYGQVSSCRLKENARNRFKFQYHWRKCFLLSVFLVLVWCLPSLSEPSRCSILGCFSLQRGLPKKISVINCCTRMTQYHSADSGEAYLACEGSWKGKVNAFLGSL